MAEQSNVWVIDDDRSIMRFVNFESLVLRKGSDYQNIKRNRDLLKMYPGAEYEIKLFLRRYRINFKSVYNNQIQLTGKFLDELEMPREIPDPGE